MSVVALLAVLFDYTILNYATDRLENIIFVIVISWHNINFIFRKTLRYMWMVKLPP